MAPSSNEQILEPLKPSRLLTSYAIAYLIDKMMPHLHISPAYQLAAAVAFDSSARVMENYLRHRSQDLSSASPWAMGYSPVAVPQRAATPYWSHELRTQGLPTPSDYAKAYEALPRGSFAAISLL